MKDDVRQKGRGLGSRRTRHFFPRIEPASNPFTPKVLPMSPVLSVTYVSGRAHLIHPVRRQYYCNMDTCAPPLQSTPIAGELDFNLSAGQGNIELRFDQQCLFLATQSQQALIHAMQAPDIIGMLA